MWNCLQSVGSGKYPGCRQWNAPALAAPAQGWSVVGCVVQEALLQLISGSMSEQLMLVRVVRPRSPKLAHTTSRSQPSQYGPDFVQAPCPAARISLLPAGGRDVLHCAHTQGLGMSCLSVRISLGYLQSAAEQYCIRLPSGT